MVNNFKKLVGIDDPNLQSVQDNVRDVLQPFVTNPTIDGVLLENQNIVTGSNLIEHKLGREYRGFYLVSTGTNQTQPIQWTSFTPTLGSSPAGMTVALTANDWSYYKVDGNVCHVEIRITFTTSVAARPYVTIVPPVLMKTTGVTSPPYGFALTNNGAGTLGGAVAVQYSDNLLYFTTDFAGTNWTLGAGRLIAMASLTYQVDDSVARGTKLIEQASPDRTKFLKVESDGKMNAKIYVF